MKFSHCIVASIIAANSVEGNVRGYRGLGKKEEIRELTKEEITIYTNSVGEEVIATSSGVKVTVANNGDEKIEIQSNNNVSTMGGMCHETPSWLDGNGWPYHCRRYAEDSREPNCVDGDQNPGVNGQTANEACCGCGGGYFFPTGEITITDESKTLCITAEGGVRDGANVIMEACYGSDGQKWIIDDVIESANNTHRKVFLIRSAANQGLCLDIDRDVSANLNLNLVACKTENDRRFNQEFDTDQYIETGGETGGQLLNMANACLTWDNTSNVFGQDNSRASGQTVRPCESSAIPIFKFDY